MHNHVNVLFTDEVIITTAILFNEDMEGAEMYLMGIEDEVNYENKVEFDQYMISREIEINALQAEQFADDNEDIIEGKVDHTCLYASDIVTFNKKTLLNGELNRKVAIEFWNKDMQRNVHVSEY